MAVLHDWWLWNFHLRNKDLKRFNLFNFCSFFSGRCVHWPYSTQASIQRRTPVIICLRLTRTSFYNQHRLVTQTESRIVFFGFHWPNVLGKIFQCYTYNVIGTCLQGYRYIVIGTFLKCLRMNLSMLQVHCHRYMPKGCWLS